MPSSEGTPLHPEDVRWLYRLLRWTGDTSHEEAQAAVRDVQTAALKGLSR